MVQHHGVVFTADAGGLVAAKGGAETVERVPLAMPMSFSIDVADIAPVSRVLAWTLNSMDSKNWIRHTEWTSRAGQDRG